MTAKSKKLPGALGAYDAKTHLPEMLRAVRSGRRFTITHRGRPVAELIPATEATHQRRDSQGYPVGYFDSTYGSCPDLVRPASGEPETREPIE